MKVFAISDPHLSLAHPKPMNIFGASWDNHFERMQAHWRERVAPEDLVLIPGDISWAMKLEDARPDLEALGALPGQKVILRGNHDYWWSSLRKVRDALPPGMHALQNDAVRFEGVTVCGSRGWVCPGAQHFADDDEKIYNREVMRFGLSLADAVHKRQPTDRLIALLHFPPFNERREASGFVEAAEKAGANILLYGHLHDNSCKSAFEGERNGMHYALVSCDHLGFVPKQICEV